MKLLGFFKKEILQTLRNPKMVAAIFIMPIIQMILVSFAMNNVPQNIRLTMDCAPNDYLAQRIHDKAIASGWFQEASSLPAHKSNGSNEIDCWKKKPFDLIQKGYADVAIIAPSGGFTKSVGEGDAKVQVLADASNIIKAQAIELYMSAIITSVIKESKLLPDNSRSSPINFKGRVLFNPEMSSRFFMFPFLIVIMVAMTIMSTITISITKEKELGTMEMLISAPLNKMHIILGKTTPYICVGFINMTAIVSLGMLFFEIPFRGSLLLFVLSFLIFAISMAAFAVLLSTFCNTQQQAMLGMMICLFLFIMFSGGLAPIDNMPPILRFFAKITPLSHYTSLARNILLKGGSWEYFLQHASAIFFFGLVSAQIAIIRLKTTL
jgi:ABC-2 type transport system permease protein